MKSGWRLSRGMIGLALAVGGVCLAGCSNGVSGSGDGSGAVSQVNPDDDGVIRFAHEKGGVPQTGQSLFASPEEAAGVFKDAVGAGDRRTLFAMFGSEGRQLVFSGDRVQENNDMRAMAARMNEYMHVDHRNDKTAVLHVGKENWPFPIPLVRAREGWFFDTVAGRDELLDRRIGEDELNAIAVCRAYVAAQAEYARKDRTGEGVIQYAQHIMSREGKRDGLYWDVKPGEEISPMGPLVAEARMEGYPASRPVATTTTTTTKRRPYHGYVFRILKAQGEAAPGGKMSYLVDGKMTKGFAMLATPAKYGASGIMTFIVGKDGKVYEKNLGESTQEEAANMSEYNPDKTWSEVKE